MSEIFVFGSNLAGRHGKGAALEARKKHGAIYGEGVGLQGRSYAIPTKDKYLRTLPLSAIELYVQGFLGVARTSPHHTFRLTPIGCGLAGYKPEQIAPMFKGAPKNIIMPPEFIAALSPSAALDPSTQADPSSPDGEHDVREGKL